MSAFNKNEGMYQIASSYSPHGWGRGLQGPTHSLLNCQLLMDSVGGAAIVFGNFVPTEDPTRLQLVAPNPGLDGPE